MKKNPKTAKVATIPRKSKGFALIATITLMVLLAILALGMLSLSTVSLRSSAQGDAITQARANARVALQIAIGEIQKYTGSDTRVTAPSTIIDSSAPMIVGVWKSWEGLNQDRSGATAGRPIKPNYDIKQQASGSGDGRFLTWLISSVNNTANPSSPSALASKEEAKDGSTVTLLGSGTLGQNDGQIHVVPNFMQNKSGAIAWWVSPENQKARLVQPHQPRANTAAGWVERAKSNSVPDLEPFGFDVLLNDLESHLPVANNTRPGRKAVSLGSTALIADGNTAKPQQAFHDLSTFSIGLLTNTATGGWRKDLSILSERWSSLPATGLPLFRLSPSLGATTSVSRPTTSNPTAAQSIIYPWSSYPPVPAGLPGNAASPFPTRYMEQHGAVTSWESLVGYLTSYRDMTYDPSSKEVSVDLAWARTYRITPWGPSGGTYPWGGNFTSTFTNTDLFNYLHRLKRSPVIGRVQWVFKVRSRKMNPTDPNTRYNIDLLVTPVYTLWNPHNVALKINEHYGIALDKSMPVAIAFARGAEALDYVSPPNLATMFRRYICGTNRDLEGNVMYDNSIPGNYTSHWEQSNNQSAGLPRTFTLAPGEARQFSLAANTAVGNSGVMGVLKEGYDGANAFGFGGGLIRSSFLRTDTLKIGMRFDNITRLGAAINKQGPGVQLAFGRWAGPDPVGSTSAGNNRYLGDGYATYTMLTNMNYSKAYWNEPVNLPTYSVLAIENNGSNPPWTEVFSIVWGPRLSIGTGAGNPDNRPTKGMLQSSPFANGVLTTSDALATNHPVNLPFDFTYHGHQSNSETIPEEGIAGYIVSGNQQGSGLSRLIVSELPLRPISSLCELQGFDLRAHNPVPPFQYNIIGNSDANPMISMESVVRDPNANAATNRQHDDSYCANHLLFDDWFVSSIAPEPETFGRTIVSDISTVYREYLQGLRALPNRAYHPIGDDKSLTNAVANQRITQIINSNDGWQRVASRFEVEGMFNINSTSVKAWRALLGHARKQQVARHTANGIDLDNTQEDYVVSRGTVASDVKAGAANGMGGIFPNASEYTGFRTLTDAQLDKLAEEIVLQVRARGPFLSLSEFVNRRLDTDKNLALAGAIQTALNSLNTGLHTKLMDNDYASKTMAPNDPKLVGANYQFEEAADGFDTYGLPGWIRQADVLRPIAPILSARDDTFTIRAYGDSRDNAGKIVASAWCEAVVYRTRDFVNQVDAADSLQPPTHSDNQRYGRKYAILSFRWLAPDEV